MPQRELDTPAVVIDIDRVQARIDGMAAAMRERGVALRPHAKTHKSLEIGRRQVAAGAVGLTVATIGEAEVFAAGGIDDLFIAYPVIAAGVEGRPAAGTREQLPTVGRGRLGLRSRDAGGSGPWRDRPATGRDRGRHRWRADRRPARCGRGPGTPGHGPRLRGDRRLYPRRPRICGSGCSGRRGRRRGGGPGTSGRLAPRRRHRSCRPECWIDPDRRRCRRAHR